MACVDGARSADKPTDDDVIIQCRPCKKAGLVIDASKYCRPCIEYMCESCATIHKRFQESENHDVVPVSNLPSFGQSSMTKLQTRFCNEHKDKDLDWYCAIHEVLLCDICKRFKHRKCKATTISEMAKVSPELFTKTVDSMTQLQCRIRTLKAERQTSMEALKSLERSLVVEVNRLKTRLVEMVERLEAEMLADIDKFVAAETSVIMDHVKTCEYIIPRLKTALGVADQAKAVGDEVTSVISAFNLSKTLKEFEPTVSEIQQELCDIDISFEPSRTLTDMLGKVDRLGTLKTARKAFADIPLVAPPIPTRRPVLRAPSRTSWPDVKVESSVDINVPYTCNQITGSAKLPDGRIILADLSSNQIILLDVNFNIQSKLMLSSEPCDVAVDGTNDVIVSVPQSKQLQWIHVTNDLRAGRTVTTGKSCWGIAVYKDEIYTGVGNIYWQGEHKSKHDGDAFVQVLDRAGTVIRSIGVDASGKNIFTYPRHITVSAGGRVFVSDNVQHRITCFTNGGDVVYDVRRNKNLSCPSGLLADEDDNLLVCCYMSNDVRVFNKDGTFTKVLLTSADGVKCPRSVSYRHSDSTLILTMWDKTPCRAYKLKYN